MTRARTQSFLRGGRVIIGAGETLDELQSRDAWIAAEADAVEEVRP